MASIEITPARVTALKKELRAQYPEVKSSHLTEALARALNFKSHAALKAEMDKFAEGDAPFVLLHEKPFIARLVELGYPEDIDPELDFEIDFDGEGITITTPLSAYDIEYKSLRSKAWRNLVVLAINEAMKQGLFTLRPGDNRWPTSIEKDISGHLFDFTLPNGLPAKGYVGDAGHEELSIHVAVNPKDDDILTAGNTAGSRWAFDAGDAVAAGWLERRDGAWLQSSDTRFNCRRHLLREMAELEAVPVGYGDKGNVIM